MPTYEYECVNCSFKFEQFQSIMDDPLKVCPQCGKEVRRLISKNVGILLKGRAARSQEPILPPCGMDGPCGGPNAACGFSPDQDEA